LPLPSSPIWQRCVASEIAGRPQDPPASKSQALPIQCIWHGTGQIGFKASEAFFASTAGRVAQAGSEVGLTPRSFHDELVQEEKRRDWENSKATVERRIPQVKRDVLKMLPLNSIWAMPPCLLCDRLERACIVSFTLRRGDV